MAGATVIINVKEFNYNIVAALPDLPRKAGNQGTRARRVYKDVVCAFDTETSYIKELDAQCLYIWQFQLYRAYMGRVSTVCKRLKRGIARWRVSGYICTQSII